MLSPHIAAMVREGGRRIVLTGSSGWLGMATLDLLALALGDDFGSRVSCFGSVRRELRLRSGRRINQRPLDELRDLNCEPTLVLHLAFLTKDLAETMDERRYSEANRSIRRHVIDALDPIGANALFLASSGAAKFAEDPDASPARRLYGSLKKEDEHAFCEWAAEHDRRAVLARIFNLSGPYINKHGNYALAAFIVDALAGRPTEIRATRPVVRGYVAIRELMSLAIALALDGGSGCTTFETGGKPMEMQEIAETVASALGEAGVRRLAMTSGPPDNYFGDDQRYRELLAENRLEPVEFATQVHETAAFLTEQTEHG
jgi:nucleoside-diphosphate-sugar epimerase